MKKKAIFALGIAAVCGVLAVNNFNMARLNAQLDTQTFGAAMSRAFPAPYTASCESRFFGGKVCDIRFAPGIGSPDNYRGLLQLLNTATSRDTMKFHILGPGGDGQAMYQLILGVQSTKAHTISIVEGDVMSADAQLAIVMDELRVAPHIEFLFHRLVFEGDPQNKDEAGKQDLQLCDDEKGKLDRGQDAYKKCIDVLSTIAAEGRAEDEALLRPLLGDVLAQQVLDGYNVIISGDDIKADFNKLHHTK